MKIKKLTALLLGLVLMSQTLACTDDAESNSQSGGDSTSQSQSSQSDESESTSQISYEIAPDESWEAAESEDFPKLMDSYIDDAAIKRSILNVGDTSRLVNAMKRAKDGEAITIATIGGSITQGSSASQTSLSYSYLFYEWWVTAFQNGNINYVNAGIGATDSYIGVHRVQKDVIEQNPDVVIVEFSVNDTVAELNQKTYDSLVRRLLSCESQPAVILLFTTQENGTSFQNIHSQIGYAYDLPMISYKDVVLEDISNGKYAWTDISPDNIHPNTMGHNIIGELLYAYLNSVLDDIDTLSDEKTPFEAESYTADLYANGVLYDSSNITPTAMEGFAESSVSYQFPNDWTAENGGSITFEVEAKNIGIMYYKTIDGKSGAYEVYVDGELAATLDGDFTGGWGDYAQADEVYTSDETATHTVEIKPTILDENTKFSVLGLLVS